MLFLYTDDFNRICSGYLCLFDISGDPLHVLVLDSTHSGNFFSLPFASPLSGKFSVTPSFVM